MHNTLPVIHPTRSHYTRASMPQIDDLQAFLAYLEKQGIRHDTVTRSPFHLHPTQNEINLGLALKLVGILDTRKYPLVIASDGYILDGHNRWYAGYVQRTDVTCIRVHVRIHTLLAHAESWGGVTHSSVASVGGIHHAS